MRAIFGALLVTVLGALLLRAEPAPAPPFIIVISTDTPTVKTGSVVSVKVQLKNTSTRDLDASANISSLTGVDPNYIYEVRDNNGDLVAKKVYEHPEFATGHAILRIVKPGETITDEQPIGRLFDMGKPGKYTIRVSRHVAGEKSNVVESYKISVNVTR